VRKLLAAVARKVHTFRAIWRLDGPAMAFRVGAASARNSVVYRAQRLLVMLRLREPSHVVDWREISRSDLRVSVVVPVKDTPPEVLRRCITSVIGQTHQAWELCMCDDHSTDPRTLEVLAAYRGSDPRIRIVTSDEPLGISGATNLAAEQATGAFIALLDHDDELHVQALAEIADAVRAYDDLDLLYTDEDKLGEDGAHREPYFKPDWSPDHLHSVMYLLHCLAIRKALFWRLGGMRSRFDGAQDYDLALRASSVARRIHHVPRVLYHWRMVAGSAAGEVGAKPAALVAGREALAEHAATLDPPGRVEDGLYAGTFRLRRALEPPPEVTLLVLTADPVVELDGRGPTRLLRVFVDSVRERTTYPGVRLLVVHDGELSDESAAAVAAAGGSAVAYDDPLRPDRGFSFARKANHAVSLVETEHLILLNDDLEVVSPGWVEALVEPLADPEVAVVGARLLYPDGRIQHAGVVIGVQGGAAHVFHGMPRETRGSGLYPQIIRNYSAVTAAVFATRRSTFDALGGFDEAFAHDYQDVDFCLRAVASGRRIVYTPFAELVHHEGATLRRTAQDPGEVALFRERWAGFMERDPHYNPNLSRERSDYEP
jgi:GT2 family glycosyltransferase